MPDAATLPPQPPLQPLTTLPTEQPGGPSTEPQSALRGLALLLLFQAAGEGITHAAALPFPGPVVGLLVLLAALCWQPIRAPVAAAAELLLAHLSLLFVPVGVGVITHLQLVSQHGLQLLVVIVLSTWLGLAATALTLRLLLRRFPHKPPPKPASTAP